MPYIAVKRENEYCVHKEENGKPTGTSLGCHKTLKEARAQITAILISERDQRVHEAMQRAHKS